MYECLPSPSATAAPTALSVRATPPEMTAFASPSVVMTVLLVSVPLSSGRRKRGSSSLKTAEDDRRMMMSSKERGSDVLRHSRAIRKAHLTVFNGQLLVPSAASSPEGETNISPAVEGRAEKRTRKEKRMFFISTETVKEETKEKVHQPKARLSDSQCPCARSTCSITSRQQP